MCILRFFMSQYKLDVKYMNKCSNYTKNFISNGSYLTFFP